PRISTYILFVYFCLTLPSFSFSFYADHRDLHSFPTRRSSDLVTVSGISVAVALSWAVRGTPLWFLFERPATARLEAKPTYALQPDRKSTRLNSSHEWISYAVFCLKKKKKVTDTGSRQRDSPHY